MNSIAARKLDLPPMTVDEFLAWDGGGHVGKLELVEGVVRAMAPASATHGVIQLNIGRAIANHLEKRASPCRAATEVPVIPPLGRRRNARAPDLAVTCSPDVNSPTFDDPVLIVEIISPGNEHETWETIQALANLSSLQEILVVQSTRAETEVYRRDAGGAWPREPEVAVTGGSLNLASIDMMLTIAEIYRNTRFA